MKRTTQLKLLLLGTLAGIPFTGCDQGQESWPPLSAENTYTNNYHVPGHGYYHAPYHGWYSFPYNYYEPGRGYFHGGNWTSQRNESPELASRPNAESVSRINQSRSNSTSHSTTRHGFGGSSRHGFS